MAVAAGISTAEDQIVVATGGHHTLLVALLASRMLGSTIAVDPLTVVSRRLRDGTVSLWIRAKRDEANGDNNWLIEPPSLRERFP